MIDHGGLPAGARLEMLVSHLADQLAPMGDLVSQLRLRANASQASQRDLDHLIQLAGHLSSQLRLIEAEAKSIQGGGRPAPE